MAFIDIFRTFHPNAEEHTFFSSARGTFSRIDHILGHKINLSRFKKIETVSSLFSDHNAMRLDINYKKKYKKHKRMEIEQYISKYQTDNWRNIKGNLKILETNDNEAWQLKTYGMQQKLF